MTRTWDPLGMRPPAPALGRRAGSAGTHRVQLALTTRIARGGRLRDRLRIDDDPEVAVRLRRHDVISELRILDHETTGIVPVHVLARPDDGVGALVGARG